MKDHRRRRTGKPRVSPSVLDRINPHAAGIDCGSAKHTAQKMRWNPQYVVAQRATGRKANFHTTG
jgi:hypothetical protein